LEKADRGKRKAKETALQPVCGGSGKKEKAKNVSPRKLRRRKANRKRVEKGRHKKKKNSRKDRGKGGRNFE